MNEKVVSIVEQLSKEYDFNLEEALKKLELNTSSAPARKIVLPWTGKVCESSCCGIKLYHRLFIQIFWQFWNCNSDYYYWYKVNFFPIS